MAPNELRERKTNGGGIVGGSPKKPSKISDSKEERTIGVVDILRIVAGLVLVNCVASYFVTKDSFLWGWKPWFSNLPAVIQYIKGPVLLNDIELRSYDGTDLAKPIYLALNGTIYDVTGGRRLYGPGGSYHIFAGKDAARGFVTGCFGEDAHPDLRGAEWTYMPTDIPDPEFPQPGDAEKETPAMKKRREAALVDAREKVKQTLEGWAKTFQGGGGKPYFEAGKVDRDPRWVNLLPKRPLCAQAQKMRPKPGAAPSDAGAVHRQKPEEGGRGFQ